MPRIQYGSRRSSERVSLSVRPSSPCLADSTATFSRSSTLCARSTAICSIRRACSVFPVAYSTSTNTQSVCTLAGASACACSAWVCASSNRPRISSQQASSVSLCAFSHRSMACSIVRRGLFKRLPELLTQQRDQIRRYVAAVALFKLIEIRSRTHQLRALRR